MRQARDWLVRFARGVPWLLTAVLVVAVLLILLSALRPKAHAQMGGVQQPMFATVSSETTFTPRSITGLAFWWVASDIGALGQATNWIDRIQSRPMTNSPGSACWATNGIVYSDGNRHTYEGGNDIIVDSTTTSLVCIFNCTDNQNVTLFEGWVDVYGWRPQSDGNFYWKNASWNLMGRTPNTWSDLVFVPGWTFYTNGVSSKTGAPGLGQFTFFQVLGDNAFNNMQVREIMIYTNTTLSSLNVSNIHWYCTNTYGFSP